MTSIGWLVTFKKPVCLGTIPHHQEVAAVLLAQIAWVKQHYSSQENPHGWLFPASKAITEVGIAFYREILCSGQKREWLNALANKYQIRMNMERLSISLTCLSPYQGR